MPSKNVFPNDVERTVVNIFYIRDYQENSFLISQLKGILWVLNRSAEALLMSTHNICFHGEKNINAFRLKKRALFGAMIFPTEMYREATLALLKKVKGQPN